MGPGLIHPTGVHTATALYAHLTWATYRRQRVIRRVDAGVVASAIHAAAARCKVHVLALGVLTEHVHVVVSFLPDAPLSDFVRDAKSESSRRINEQLPGRLRWQRGFHANSLSRSHVHQARTYVARQFQRHPDRIPQ